MRREYYDQRALAIMECAERGLSKSRAAAKLGLNAATIRKYAKLYDIQFNPTPGGIDRLELQAAADEGLSRHEAAKRFGVRYNIIHMAAHELGIVFVRPGTGPSNIDRADAMEAMYRAGKTLEEIGGVYGVSRERVRQIIKKYRGVTADDGGQAVKARFERERKRAEREAKSLRKHGCSWKQYKSLLRIGREMKKAGHGPATTPTGAFASQRANANKRSIEWNLALWEWWQIWQASGHWEQRGRGKGYVMCRFGDTGPYEVGNVYIATAIHNVTIQPNNPYRLGHPDHAKVIAKMAKRAAAYPKYCSHSGCDHEHYAHGLCRRHYDTARYAAARERAAA